VGRDLNLGPPRYEAAVLTTRHRRSVFCREVGVTPLHVACQPSDDTSVKHCSCVTQSKFDRHLFRNVTLAPSLKDRCCAIAQTSYLWLRRSVPGFSPLGSGFVVDKVALGQVSVPRLSGLPVSIIPLLLHIHSYMIWGMDKGFVSGTIPQRHSPTPSQQ
jgi:hypothetical protein